MSIPRSAVRESAFLIIFEKSFRDDDIEVIFDDAINSLDDDKEFVVDENVKNLVMNVYKNCDEFDEIIKKFSDKRSIDRIPKINLAILRLALYESIYDEKVPVNVAISEAVRIAKKYAQKNDAAFINGVLGAYSRTLSSENTESCKEDNE